MRSTLTWPCLLAGIFMLSAELMPAATAAETPRQWALLIGVQAHDDASLNLRFTSRDVECLETILLERAGVPRSHVLSMTDASSATWQPTLENLRREVPRFLNQAAPEDQVLIFFSGHGETFDGETYLIPRDFRRASPTATSLPARELRTALANCPAQVKFLVLDCCHAGGTKETGNTDLSAETLAKSIVRERVAGCVVLASCRAEEKSWEWAERRQGVFAWWLCRALEGGADRDGDGRLTADEVYEYTCDRVSQTVRQVFSCSQTPVRMIGGDVQGVPTVLTLRPEPPESLCRRLAEHLDLEIRHRQLKKVGVLEFLQPLRRTEGLTAANLPAYCAEQVRAALQGLATGSYLVLDDAAMKQATKGVAVEAIGDPLAMRELRERTGGLDAAITGSLRRRGNKLHVQCDLVATADGASLTSPSGVLPLSEDLLADNGASFDNRQRPDGSPYAPVVVSHVQTQAAKPHPLLQQDFPFRVEVWSIQARPGEEITADTLRKRKEFIHLPPEKSQAAEDGQAAPEKTPFVIAARENEVFEIRVWNRYGNPVAMTLLVDGLNTLGQRRERLGQAWSWLVSPMEDSTKSIAIEGWYLPKAVDARPGDPSGFTLKRFQFTDISRSVAARQNFRDSIGLMTAAFYGEYGRAVGVGEGPEEQRQLQTVNFRPGRLLGVVQIRYVDERELLDKLEN